jgi:predicted nucleotidyltransferase component of viral defense system
MALDTAVHKNILFQVLKDVYTDTTIAPFLGFKGGTAAFMHYGLTRFSIDLDFDLLDEDQGDVVYRHMEHILKGYGTIKQASRKRFSMLFLLSYQAHAHTVKVEVNRGVGGYEQPKDDAGPRRAFDPRPEGLGTGQAA